MTGKMGILGVIGLAATAATLSGCVVDSGRSCGPSDITFSWSLSANGRTGVSCGDVGAETVVIVVGGATAEFPCRNYAAITDPVVPATYTTSFQLLDASRNVIATLDPMDVPVGSCGVNLGQVVFPVSVCTSGFVSLNWTIAKAATNAPLSCAQAAATKVRLIMGAMSVDYACNDGAGVTPEVAPGNYQTTAQLLGPGDQVLSQLPDMNIRVCGNITLPPIVFPTP